MVFYILDPEPSGDSSSSTTYHDKNAWPMVIESLDFRFEAWQGDCVVAGVWIMLALKQVADALAASNLTGFTVKPCTLSKSNEYRWYQHEGLNYAPKELPEFKWLDIGHKPFDEDLGILMPVEKKDSLFGFVISDRALELVKSKGQLIHAKLIECEKPVRLKA